MKKLYLIIFALLSVSSVYASTPLTGSAVHSGNCKILVGDPIVASNVNYDGVHATHGKIQGMLELNVESAVEGVSVETLVHAYPNPVQDYLYVTRPENGAADYTLISTDGKIVLKGTLTEPTESIDVSAIPSGIFIFSLYQSDSVLLKAKLIKR